MSSVQRIEMTHDSLQINWKRWYRTWRLNRSAYNRTKMDECIYAAALERALASETRRRERAEMKLNYVDGVYIHKDQYRTFQRQEEYINSLVQQRDRLQAESERMLTALEEIEAWTLAYPLEVFPEPDFERAAALLEAGGMTLDSVSASNMRHVIERVSDIVREGLYTPESSQS